MLKKITLVVLCFLFISAPLVAQQRVTSTDRSGAWSDPLTWDTNKVPSSEDTVVINTSVFLDMNARCKSLSINRKGQLSTNVGRSSRFVLKTGSLDNKGAITNMSSFFLSIYVTSGCSNMGKIDGRLALHIKGDVTNGGSWTCDSTVLEGLSGQALLCKDSASFSGKYFNNKFSANPINLKSDVYFAVGKFNFNKAVLKTSNSSKVNFMGCVVEHVQFKGTDAVLKVRSNMTIFQQTVFDNCSLSGDMKVAEEVVFNRFVSLDGLLEDNPFNNAYTLTINGDFVNNGVIRKTEGKQFDFIVKCKQKVENNGVWDNLTTILDSEKDQEIRCKKGKSFTNSIFKSGNKNKYKYLLTSDLSLVNTSFSLANKTIQVKGAYNMNFVNSSLQYAVVENMDVRNSMQFRSESFLRAVEVQNMTLEGRVLVDTGVVFRGNILLLDTLTKLNPTNECRLCFTDHLVNRGLIANDGKMFTVQTKRIDNYGTILNDINMKVAGNIRQDGVWNCNSLSLHAKDSVTITSADTCRFILKQFRTNNPKLLIQAQSKLHFENAHIELSNARLVSKQPLDFYFKNCRLENVHLECLNKQSSVFMEGNSFTKNSRYKNIIFNGKVVIDQTVDFEGQVVNLGEISDKLSSNDHILRLYGDFTNKGSICNISTIPLTILCYGSIRHEGTRWANGLVKMKGDTIQDVWASENTCFEPKEFIVEKTNGYVFFKTDFSFKDCIIKLNNKSFLIDEGKKMSISGQWIEGGFVEGVRKCYFYTSNAYAKDITFKYTTFEDLIPFKSDLKLYSGVTIKKLMQKMEENNPYRLTILGDVTINGDVENISRFPLTVSYCGSVDSAKFKGLIKFLVDRRYFTCRGAIKDSEGQPVETSVVIQNNETGEVREHFYTDSNGGLALTLPDSGKWNTYISDDKYYPFTKVLSSKRSTFTNLVYTYEDLLKTAQMNVIETLSFNRMGFEINAGAKSELDRLADFIKKHHCSKVILLGHTDETGELKVNDKLSLRRAESVKSYLVARGCKPEVLLTKVGRSLITESADDIEENKALKRKVLFQFAM